jgi:hypothetical protein
MAKFCVKCRAALDADAKFCDECGAPVRAARAVSPAAAALTSAPMTQPGMVRTAAGVKAPAPQIAIDWRNVGQWGGGVVAMLVAAGGIAAYLAIPPSSPGTSDVEAIVNANAAKVTEATCLSNFPYDKNPVQVGGFDINTQRWMAVLSRAGIYTPPRQVGNGSIFGGSLEYSHTAEGDKKVHNSKLCYADGLTVSSVQFGKPVKVGKQWHVQGTYSQPFQGLFPTNLVTWRPVQGRWA